jgi:hypothetical protein
METRSLYKGSSDPLDKFDCLYQTRLAHRICKINVHHHIFLGILQQASKWSSIVLGGQDLGKDDLDTLQALSRKNLKFKTLLKPHHNF